MTGRSLRYEDLHVGLAFLSPGRTVTEADVVAFAGLTGDYSELHTSEEYARHSQFGRRVAHGMLGLAYAHGLMWPRTGELRDCAIAFLGIGDWRFVAPLFIGDTMFVRYTVAELRESRSQPDKAIATFDVRIVNQHDETIQQGRKALLVSKTPLPAVTTLPAPDRAPEAP
jgi:acyl dehydratase